MRKLRPILAVFVLSLGLSLGLIPETNAAEPAGVATLPLGPSGNVIDVIDGDTIKIDSIDADIRLVGIQAPKLPLGRRGFQSWPLADAARAALADLIDGRTVTLAFGPTRRDRNGRTLAHILRDDGLWIQGEMLRLGMARIYTFADNRVLIAELRAQERDARNAKRGIWAHPFYAIRDAGDAEALKRETGSFQIVAGVVRDAAKVRERIYLNFGADFRTDFTVSIDRRDWRTFDRAGVDPLALEGAKIEVRGWLVSRNGPMIEVTHPEQIEPIPSG
ncbi:MAG: thermonuclease family protein [Rhodobacteraceae bacterium]|nr:thermonuclease family protein [Paracoccaceae bacterium]